MEALGRLRRDDVLESPAVAGDERTFEDLVTRHAKSLGSLLVQVVEQRELAEDLLQETFLTAYRHRHRLPSQADAQRAWLYGIARNRALSALRSRRRRVALTMRLKAWTDNSPATGHAVSDALAVRQVLVQTLSPDDRLLIVLRYLHGFDAPELAQMTGKTPEAVRQRLARASRRLRLALAAEGEQEPNGDFD